MSPTVRRESCWAPGFELLLVAAGDDVLVLERGRKGVSVDARKTLIRPGGWPRAPGQRARRPTTSCLGAYRSALARATLLARRPSVKAADCVDNAVAVQVRQQFSPYHRRFQR